MLSAVGLGRDEVVSAPPGAVEVRRDVGIAFHVFALPQAEPRARTLQKRCHAKRSAVVLCAVLSSMGPMARRNTGVDCCTDGQAEKAALK
jgi:hypothetical protein